MSWQALGHVIGLRLPANEKWLLVCLAHHGDEWGDSIFPSLDTLAHETGMSRSTVRRAFEALRERGAIEQVAWSTPVSPAFYRIVGIPEPQEKPPTKQDCHPGLRRAVIQTFGSICEYCKGLGTNQLGPDDKPWHVDRVVPGKRGGVYMPDNVTLACRTCNGKKRAKEAPPGTRTMAQMQQERGRPNNALSSRQGGSNLTPPQNEGGGGRVEPRGSQPDASEDPTSTLPGANVLPEPFSDPFSDPVPERKAGAPPRLTSTKTEKPSENPADNIGVITKLAHEVLDQLGATHPDLRETLKSRCAHLHVAYDSGVVRAALDSAEWQRRHGRRA